MPNWCNNVLTVVGSVDELKEFARYVESDEMVLDFEEIIPEPPFENICSEGKDRNIAFKEGPGDHHWDYRYYCDPNHWGMKFWGTKWNLDGFIRKEIINGDLVYSFDTAWAPPTGIIRELVRVFDNLIIKCEFAEPGMCFFGECGGFYGSYYEWDAELTSKTHPEFWTYPCYECGEDFLQDGRVCPHCGSDENPEFAETIQ